MLRWSQTAWRKAEAVRDTIMLGVGTDDPWVEEHMTTVVTYRRPLRIDEVNQMADTPEVRERRGRP